MQLLFWGNFNGYMIEPQMKYRTVTDMVSWLKQFSVSVQVSPLSKSRTYVQLLGISIRT